MPSTPKVRRIEVEDLPIVRDLAMIIWPRLYRNVVSPVQMDAILSHLFDLDTLEDDMETRGHVYWVAEINGRPVGFLSAEGHDAQVNIHKVYVLEDYRGGGIGKAMMQAALDHFADARTLSLIVPKDHDHGIGFSLKSGFSFDREEPTRVGGYDLTNYIMRKDLTPAAVS
ncbi:MAG: GNAT family N-acetyltransferase [Asticcacaulis sp.]